MNVKYLLKKKGNAIHSIGPELTVYEALEKMENKNVGALLVMQKDRLVGIISERDYARKVILKGRYSKDTLVRDVMTQEVLVASQERKLNECMALMTAKRFRHLPIVEDDKVIGMVSIGDVVKNIIDEQEHTIEDYENYIHGWG